MQSIDTSGWVSSYLSLVVLAVGQFSIDLKRILVEWWVWIVPQMPILSWLEEARDRVLQLNTVQLAELLTQVELQEGEVLHTFYRVS